jgi:hypothetical protein
MSASESIQESFAHEVTVDRLIRQRIASLQEAEAARLQARRARKQRNAWMMFAFLELTVGVVYALIQFADWAKAAF